MLQGLYIPMLIKHWVRAIPGIGHGFGWGDVFRQGNFLSGLAVLVPSFWRIWMLHHNFHYIYAAAAKSLQSCPTLWDPVDGSPPGSPVPGILQARTLEWVAISFSNAWKWKVKVKSLSRARLLATPWTAAYQVPPSMGFSRQESRSGVPLPSPHCMYTHP